MRLDKNEKVLKPVRANAGVSAAYQKELDTLVSEMQASLVYWLRAEYRANPPEALALDASPASELNAAMKRLAARWQRRFNKDAPALAKKFAQSASRHTDIALQGRLREAGLTVRFSPTRTQNDIFAATVNQNVALIKSIAAQHLTDVQGIVQRSVQAGRQMSVMSKELQDKFGVTKRRAALICTTQNNLATASMTKVRYVELGIEEAIWYHSSAGKTHRATHEAMDRKRYIVSEGMYDSAEGRKVQPGELINCRCYGAAVMKGLS
jgi:SPP1 gp7 family putative phage head morphogenesis protein